jgi:hypothetical protein
MQVARWVALGVLAAIGGWLAPPVARAQEPETPKVTIKGRIAGGERLLNPVWQEATDPKSHRYTFRMRSTTVAEDAKNPSAYLPKELCVAVLKAEGGAAARGKPEPIGVSGGRTTPVTLVVPEGQNVQFVNYDPFPHKLYDAGKVAGGLAPEETKPAGTRTWKPPKAGAYEIRDLFFPSVRSWIVVEPKSVGYGFVDLKGELSIPNLEPGDYELQAFFGGKRVGKALAVSVRPTPDVQQLPNPLVVAEGAGPKPANGK